MDKRWKTNHASSVIFLAVLPMGRLGQQPDGSFLPLQAVVGGTTTTHDGFDGSGIYSPCKKWLIFLNGECISLGLIR